MSYHRALCRLSWHVFPSCRPTASDFDTKKYAGPPGLSSVTEASSLSAAVASDESCGPRLDGVCVSSLRRATCTRASRAISDPAEETRMDDRQSRAAALAQAALDVLAELDEYKEEVEMALHCEEDIQEYAMVFSSLALMLEQLVEAAQQGREFRATIH